MDDDQFRRMCNTFGFAPSRSLREMMDAVVRQSVLSEREACAKICETEFCGDDVSYYVAAAIRARGLVSGAAAPLGVPGGGHAAAPSCDSEGGACD